MFCIDIIFWCANLLKFFQSGWVPMALSACIFLLLHTHDWGKRAELAKQLEEEHLELSSLEMSSSFAVSTVPGLVRMLQRGQVARSESTAVFLTSKLDRVPASLSAVARELGALPKTILLLNVSFTDEPFVAEDYRLKFEVVNAGLGIYSAQLLFGYAEPLTSARFDVHETLLVASSTAADLPARGPSAMSETSIARSISAEGNLESGSHIDERITYIFTRKHYAASADSNCFTKFQVEIFAALVRNSRGAMAFYGLESNAVLEVTQVVQL